MEKLETINQSLIDEFGIDSLSALPMYRVVWADDQYEKRLTKYTDSGVEMLHEEVRLLPKYPWCKGFYVLERLEIVPEPNLRELCGRKIDYNILHKFMGANELPVPPAFWACKFVIDTVNAAMGRGSLNKYVNIKDPDVPDRAITSERDKYEANKSRIDQIQNELFGDESGLQGVTHKAGGSGIIMPSNYGKREN